VDNSVNGIWRGFILYAGTGKYHSNVD